jgi:hypothetical protein
MEDNLSCTLLLKKKKRTSSAQFWLDCHIVNLSFNCCYLETCNKTHADSWILSMYFLEILMCVNVLPYLLGKYVLPITELLQTQFKHLFVNL